MTALGVTDSGRYIQLPTEFPRMEAGKPLKSPITHLNIRSAFVRVTQHGLVTSTLIMITIKIKSQWNTFTECLLQARYRVKYFT